MAFFDLGQKVDERVVSAAPVRAAKPQARQPMAARRQPALATTGGNGNGHR